jgi:hypothetical protein
MSVKQASVAVMLAGMWALGCSNSNSPTSGSAFMVVLNVTFANTAMASTITQAQLVVDGGTAAIFAPSAPAATTGALSTSGQAGTGPHTMAVVINSQTTSPNSYTTSLATVQVFDLNRTLLKTITLPNQTAVLATGDSISYSFSL